MAFINKTGSWELANERRLRHPGLPRKSQFTCGLNAPAGGPLHFPKALVQVPSPLGALVGRLVNSEGLRAWTGLGVSAQVAPGATLEYPPPLPSVCAQKSDNKGRKNWVILEMNFPPHQAF